MCNMFQYMSYHTCKYLTLHNIKRCTKLKSNFLIIRNSYSKMSGCKLTYFNLRALGEPIRMLLTYGDIPFEEKRIDRFGKEWTDTKPSYPLGQLPLLEIDGASLHQSRAICRYVAKKCGLNGVNDKEAAEIDIVADVFYDFIMKMRSLREIEDPAVHEKKFEEFKNTAIPFFLDNLNKMAKVNGGYLACGKLSWADFYFAGATDYLNFLCRRNILDGYDNLKVVVDNVNALSKLKEYISNRPKTEF